MKFTALFCVLLFLLLAIVIVAVLHTIIRKHAWKHFEIFPSPSLLGARGETARILVASCLLPSVLINFVLGYAYVVMYRRIVGHHSNAKQLDAVDQSIMQHLLSNRHPCRPGRHYLWTKSEHVHAHRLQKPSEGDPSPPPLASTEERLVKLARQGYIEEAEFESEPIQ